MEGSLGYTAYIDTRLFNRGLDEMEARLQRIGTPFQNQARQIDSTLNGISNSIKAYFAFDILKSVPDQIIKIRGEFQQLELTLTAFLKNKQSADILLGQIVQEASTSPYTLGQVGSGVQQLLAYGTSAKDVVQELRTLGTVASAVGKPLNDIVSIYGTLQAQEKVNLVDIKQFALRGIPIYEELAKVLGVSKDKVTELVSAGQVGFPEIQKAFQNLTTGGGKFAGVMEAQSKSLIGLRARFDDATQIAINGIGKANEAVIASAIKGATAIVDNYQPLLNIIATVTASYGAYRAGLMLVASQNAIFSKTILDVNNALTANSSLYAQEISAKLANAQASITNAEANLAEATAKHQNALASVELARQEMIALNLKRVSGTESVRIATLQVAQTQKEVLLADQKVASLAVSNDIQAKQIAQNELKLAQDRLILAEQERLSAIETARALKAESLTKLTALDTASKTANTLATNVNTASQAVNTATMEAEAVATTKLNAVQSLRLALMERLTAIQVAFNASLLANPIVFFTTAVIGLATAIYLFSDSLSGAEQAQRDLLKAEEDDRKAKEDLISKTNELSSVIQNKNATLYSQGEAFKALKALYAGHLDDLTLEKFKLLEVGDAQKRLNEEQDKISFEKTKARLKEIEKTLDDLNAKKEKISNFSPVVTSPDAGSRGTQMSALIQLQNIQQQIEKNTIEAEAYRKKVKEQEQAEYEASLSVKERIQYFNQLKTLLEQQRGEIEKQIVGFNNLQTGASIFASILKRASLKTLGQEIDDVTGKLKGLQVSNTDGGNKSFWEGEKKRLEDLKNNLGYLKANSKYWNELTAQIKKADDILKKYSNTQKEVKSAIPKIDAPFGSLDYYEQVAQRAETILNRLNQGDTKNIQKFIAERDNAEAKATELRNRYDTLSFQEVIDRKKKLYENYQTFAYSVSKNVADKQFADLIKGGKTFEEYLKNRINAIDVNKPMSPMQTDQLASLTQMLDNVQKTKSPLQKFDEDLKKLKDSSENSVDYLDKLKLKIEELNTTGGGLIGSDVNIALAQLQDEVNATYTDINKVIKDFTEKVEGGEAQRLAIIRKYDALIKGVRLSSNQEVSRDSYEKNIQAIDQARKAELEAWAKSKAEALSAYKDLQKIIGENSTATAKERLNAVNQFIEVLKNSVGEETQVYKDWVAKRDKMQKDLGNSLDKKTASQVVSVAKELGNAFKNLGGDFELLGEVLSTGASSFTDISKLMKEGVITGELYSTAINIGIKLLSSMIEAQQEVSKRNSQIMTQTIAQQLQYNQLLNDAIGLRYKAYSSALLGNTVLEFQSKISQLKDAQLNFNKSLKDLQGTQKNVNKLMVEGFGSTESKSFWGSLVTLISPIGLIKEGVSALTSSVADEVPKALIKIGSASTGFLGTSVKDVYRDLFKEFPDLIDTFEFDLKNRILKLQKLGAVIPQDVLDKINSNGYGQVKFNVELAKSIISSGRLEENTQKLLEDTVAWYEKLQAINKEIDDIVKNLAGSLANDLRTALVDAFKAGTDSAIAFGQSVNKVIENIVSQLIFERVFSKAFADLEKDLKASFDPINGDMNVIDDFNNFYKQQGVLIDQFNKALEDARTQAEKYGFDIFAKTPTSATSSTESGLAGTIKGVTEDTAQILAGQITTIRINGASILDVSRQQLGLMVKIESNTRYLIDIYKVLSINSDPLRAKGILG